MKVEMARSNEKYKVRWIKWVNALGWEGVLLSKEPQADHKLVVYSNYRMNGFETVSTAAIGYVACFVAVYLFYQYIPASCLLAILGLIAPRFRRKQLLLKRRQRLQMQFKEALFSLTSSLAAGRSIENAFRATLGDLSLLYTDPRTYILREFQMICYRLDSADSLEKGLKALALRAEMEEISQFVDTLAACKRTGGNLVQVMKQTSTIIGEKLEVESDIAIMIAQKRFEANIMMIVPFVFLGFLGFAAPDYMEPLYGGVGYVVLTTGLLLLISCYCLIQRIMRIQM